MPNRVSSISMYSGPSVISMVSLLPLSSSVNVLFSNLRDPSGALREERFVRIPSGDTYVVKWNK